MLKAFCENIGLTPTEGGHQAVIDGIRGIASLVPEQCCFARFGFFK